MSDIVKGRTWISGEVVTAVKINEFLDDAEIGAGKVTTAKIADANVTTAKIADAAVTLAKLPDGVLSADTAGRAKMADQFVNFAKVLDGILPVYSATKTDTQFFAARDEGAVTGLDLAVTKPRTGNKIILAGYVSGMGRRATLSIQVEGPTSTWTDLLTPDSPGLRVPGMFGFGEGLDTSAVSQISCPLFAFYTATGATTVNFRVYARTGNNGKANINWSTSDVNNDSYCRTVSAIYAIVIP
jgi:hypothetical protein